MKYIVFGAGVIGKQAINLLGKENIVFLIDNAVGKTGKYIEGLKVCSLEEIKYSLNDYKIVIAVSEKYQGEIIRQLNTEGITSCIMFSEIKSNITKKLIEQRPDYIEIYNKAITWILNHSITNEGIINNTNLKKSYPEVTGYYIPTLIRWGYRDLAVSYAKWLCSVQKPEGSWCDTNDTTPYVFDTAQILKGLLSVKELLPGVESHIIKGCDWLLSNIHENGRMTTPSTDAWGTDENTCSELIHLYCLSPLLQAAEVYHRPEYEEAAYRVLSYYKENAMDKIMNFSLLSHFYAYVMEALVDMGETELARQAMNNISHYQKKSGAVPAYHHVDWVCSTGLFQLALVWFRLGDLERGNAAFRYACSLQNESGGWFGSYVSEENGKETNTYFPASEISWAVKYFLDALYYKNLAEFNQWADSFLPEIDKEDGRYQLVRKEILLAENKNVPLKVCDVGCGKGRYLNNLLGDVPQNSYYGVDLSEAVLKYMTDKRIEKRQGSLTCIPDEDDTFDIVYTCEALEHAVDTASAVRELARVTRPGGKVIIIDKNQEALGRLNIAEWETWFGLNNLKEILEGFCSKVTIIRDIPYEGKMKDNLFAAWIGVVKG